MHNCWFTSDTHFRHANILTFTGNEGQLIRPEFKTVEEMDDCMITNWNECVKEGDRIYHLGDVIMHSGTPEIQSILGKLNGSKRLILGNHDTDYLKSMLPYFKKVSLWRLFKEYGFICSHLPLLEGQFTHKVPVNVHGHIHEKLMGGLRYINVCVEHTQYRPLHLDEIIAIVDKRKKLMETLMIPLTKDGVINVDIS